MMKNLPSILMMVLISCTTYAQIIVSQNPQNKNVVLEEFTGIYCGYCPDGHAIANQIKNDNPERVTLINVHAGGYATPSGNDPDFRTAYGSALVSQAGVTGFPSGSVNRQVFPGRENTSGKTAMYRNFWSISSTETLALASPVNIGVEASIDINTNVLTVHVEAYYTANSPEATNFLNVALLQNNTKGPQSGGNAGNNYVHMHRLVEMITGQWGEIINTTTSGTLVDRTFTYTIPADYRGVPVKLADMEIAAYISNTKEEIPTGTSVIPSYTGLTHANDANLKSITEIPQTCKDKVAPVITIQNNGTNPITSLAIDYTINGDSNTYNWTGNILSLQSESIELPEANFTIQSSNDVAVTLPGDDNNANNSVSTQFDQAPAGVGNVNMELKVNNRGSEIRWYVYDSNGTALYKGGPYPNGNPQTINESFVLPADCYEFRVLDTANNGGGEITITDIAGTQLYHTNGAYGSGEKSPFSSNGVLSTNQSQLDNVSLYPNPATSTINLRNAENASIQIFDILGKLILSEENIAVDAQINVSQLQGGTYFMKIAKDNLVATKKFLVVK